MLSLKIKLKVELALVALLNTRKKDLTIRYRTKLENSKELNKQVEKKTYRNKISLQFKLNKTYRPFISYDFLIFTIKYYKI